MRTSAPHKGTHAQRRASRTRAAQFTLSIQVLCLCPEGCSRKAHRPMTAPPWSQDTPPQLLQGLPPCVQLSSSLMLPALLIAVFCASSAVAAVCHQRTVTREIPPGKAIARVSASLVMFVRGVNGSLAWQPCQICSQATTAQSGKVPTVGRVEVVRRGR